MNIGKKWIAATVIATTVFVVSAPASAADSGDVAAGVVFGLLAGAIIANADNHDSRYYEPAPRLVAHHAPSRVYYDAPVYRPAPVYVNLSYAHSRVRHRWHHHKRGYKRDRVYHRSHRR